MNHSLPPAVRLAYAQGWPALSQAIAEAQARADAKALREAVHRLRGSLAWLGDPALTQTAAFVEEQLAAGRQPDAALWRLLQSRCEQLAADCARAPEGDVDPAGK